METKTHYRKVLKSDHLGSADLEEMIEEGKSLIFTIDHVNQEYGTRVAGRKIDANIAYFKENIKPLVLNATNAKVIKGFAGTPFIELWKGIPIELYVDPTITMKGETVGGVRIKPVMPKLKQSKPNFTESNFAKAKEANATIAIIKSRYNITEKIAKKYEQYVKS